jgi:hypothetical protein
MRRRLVNALNSDIDAIRSKDGIRRAVVGILQEIGILTRAATQPGRKPHLRLVKPAEGDSETSN